MNCRQVVELMNAWAPEDYALGWDRENVGLQVGNFDREIRTVYLAVDATDEVIAEAMAKNADLIITHHPMIFGGIRKINTDTSLGRRILVLAEQGIGLYAMHTNYDIAGMADAAANRLQLGECEVLEDTFTNEKGPQGIGRIGKLPQEMTVVKLCKVIKEAFDLDNVTVFGDLSGYVRRVAISPGSGKDMVEIAKAKGAEVLVTGDIGHHTGIDAVADGMVIIDAGHYGLEHIFNEEAKGYLEKCAPELQVYIEDKKRPFVVI